MVEQKFTRRDLKEFIVTLKAASAAYSDVPFNTDVLGPLHVSLTGMAIPAEQRKVNCYTWGGRSRAVRHMLIAYGLVRGLAYSRIESKTREKPSARHVHAVIVNCMPAEIGSLWTYEKVREALS
jgi:hypothetical protein